MNRVLILQHASAERPGTIADVLVAKGYSIQSVLTFDGQAVPQATGEAEALVILGGPMGVYERDRYPFLQNELQLIENTLAEGKPIVGICLGSQLLAAALGAKVGRGKQKEIGWHPVTFTEDGKDDSLLTGTHQPLIALHWHGDIFDLPLGAVRLASSDLTECQAFRYGKNAYGFLFHMETTHEILRSMTETFEGELTEEGIDSREIIGAAREYLPKLQQTGRIVFERWTASLSRE